MKDVSLLELLKSGAHFGHSTSRWNPKMKQYIFTVRGNIHILDLEKTRRALLKAASLITDTVASGGTVLFVGTKKQSRDFIKKAGIETAMPFVNVRWLGGSFTNFKTIQKTIRKMEKLQDLKASGELETRYTKKERLLIERELTKMARLFEGIKELRKMPDVMFVADINHDDTAVREARKVGVKVVALVDSNSNPSLVDLPIPCNDDATKAIELVISVLADAALDGKKKMKSVVVEKKPINA